MKNVKLEHSTAEFVRAQAQPTIWRLYNDQHFGVGDDIELIDKRNPQDTETWESMGVVEILEITEKRLRDFTAEERRSVFGLELIEDVVRLLQAEYGPQVTELTPLRILYCTTLGPRQPSTEHSQAKPVSEVSLYTDGGSRGNPGPSASGYVILDMENTVLIHKGMYLGVTTNNQAEYQALKLGLEEAQRLRATIVHVYMDSMLVVNQMKGIFKVKNRDLWPIHDAITMLIPHFKKVTFTHVPRELNKAADKEVNEALDLALKHAPQQER